MTCKSLAEQLPAAVAYCNQLPLSLLYGPACPTSQTHQLHPRYTCDMFSKPLVISRTPTIPRDIAELSTGERRLHKTNQSFVRRVSALVMIPAVFSVVCGVWTLRRYGLKGVGVSQLTFTMVSGVKDMKGFGG
jgi:hypothetical protein